GGERQRVGIARAIVKNPKIIIADEPTGNLDSTNTIEIMNIIKSISRDRLVVLVTHEADLARFYASRIIELKDGKIEKDYENDNKDLLNYRLDNKIYLRDFDKQEKLKKDSVEVNFYGGKEDSLKVDVVIKNGNIYIRTVDGSRVEVVDAGSAIEFVDDHYKEIDKTLYENYSFDFDKVADTGIKEKYSSIVGFFPSLLRGFKKLANYPVMKKLLLIGFVAAGLFVTYSLSSIYASLDVKDENFISANREYYKVNIPKITMEKFTSYESMPEVKYLFPGSSKTSMTFKMDFFYQTYGAEGSISGSLTDIGDIAQSDLLCGRMPENEYEVVVDKLSIERMFESGVARQVGITQVEQMLDQELTVNNLKPFKIVGITDKVQSVIYTMPSMFIDILYNCCSTGTEITASSLADFYEQPERNLLNYRTYDKEYTLKKGRLPEKDYEIIVPQYMSSEMALNKKCDVKVNGKKLKVVGYYTSPDDAGVYLSNQNTIKYVMIGEAGSFDIAPAEKADVVGAFDSQNIKAVSIYKNAKDEYVNQRRDMTGSTIILGIIILAISLIEILLMVRSSFLSRIKEVGIYRAIGVKKTDIYKMFLGEIIAITTVASMVGVIIMSYILYNLCKIEYIAGMFAINPVVFFGAVIILYVFNSIVGLVPVFTTMRKPPAAILARYDVD
ncbi:MAG: FtsX-like permease family protein, partial [Anaerovoracaceae bacterium]